LIFNYKSSQNLGKGTTSKYTIKCPKMA